MFTYAVSAHERYHGEVVYLNRVKFINGLRFFHYTYEIPHLKESKKSNTLYSVTILVLKTEWVF